jgi:hypothetical protein
VLTLLRLLHQNCSGMVTALAWRTLIPRRIKMGLEQRVVLYKSLEAKRGRPLVVYVTSARRQAEAQIASDAISEIVAQLQALPPDATELDLFLVSNGGDGTVAWRIVSLIRERVKKFSVLVPQAAFSAATLIALGADEIVMHPYGNLGPTDPQITNRSKNVQFGSQDLAAFLTFAKEDVGLTDQGPLLELFRKFSEEVGFVGIGVAARSAQLTASMSEKLLRLHMKSESQSQKAKAISDSLNTKFFHHGYPVSKTEAKEIGLPVAPENPGVESLMWEIWLDIEADLKLREPFSPLTILRADPTCAGLFQPPPPNTMIAAPTARFTNTMAMIESHRHATRHVVEGEVQGMRTPDLKLNLTVLPIREGWEDVPIPPVADTTPPAKSGKVKAHGTPKNK